MFFDPLIELGLALVQFSLPRFDRRLAPFEPLATLAPTPPIPVQGGDPLVAIRFAEFQFFLAPAQPSFLIGERLGADVRQLGGATLELRFSLEVFRFPVLELLGTLVELLLTLPEPELGVAILGLEIRFLSRDLLALAFELIAVALQPVGQLGRMCPKLLD